MTFKFLRDDGQFAPFGSTTATPLQTVFTNILSSNTTSSSTGTWIQGPVITQGSSGTWLVNAWATLATTSALQGVYAVIRLVDSVAQTQVISGAFIGSIGYAAAAQSVSLSGIVTSPTSNLQLIFTGITTGTYTMYRSASATLPSSGDSGIIAVRIG